MRITNMGLFEEMNMSGKVRIGFMGATWPCRSHAEGLSSIRSVKFEAVSEPDMERRTQFLRKFGEMQEYNDYRQMLQEAQLDAVVIGLPTALHFEATQASLDAGLHVLCEKPPTTNAAEMIEIARLAKKKRLTYMFARQPRFAPESLEARKLVQRGRIGEVYHAEGKWIRCRGIPWQGGGWFVNKEKGGGVLLDLGVHSIDNAWFVMGCPRPVEAFAGLHCAFSHLAPEGIEYTAEDAAVGMIRFENGATLHFMVTFALNTAGRDAGKTEGFVKPEWGEIKIYGTKGGIDVGAGKFISGRKNVVGVTPLKKPKRIQPVFTAQAKEFIRAVRAQDEPLNSPDQAVMLMQMLDALKRSGETRRAVEIAQVQ